MALSFRFGDRTNLPTGGARAHAAEGTPPIQGKALIYVERRQRAEAYREGRGGLRPSAQRKTLVPRRRKRTVAAEEAQRR
jgi:hypothetical protein